MCKYHNRITDPNHPDVLICRKAFGWEWRKSAITGRSCLYAPEPNDGNYPNFARRAPDWMEEYQETPGSLVHDFGFNIPKWHEDMSLVRPMIEVISRSGFRIIISYDVNRETGHEFVCEVDTVHEEGNFSIEAECSGSSMPEAVATALEYLIDTDTIDNSYIGRHITFTTV